MVYKKFFTYVFCFYLIFNLFDLITFCDLSDQDFIELIKKMSVKNHQDPALYKNAYAEALTEDARIKVMLTDKFYECVYKNQNYIQTKSDLNLICGYLIYFK